MPKPTALRRRLRPLQLAVVLQAVLLWVPIEKLFLSEIGFDPMTIGIMTAVYAGVVPLIEIPSGVLADRWSRRSVLLTGTAGLAGAALIGGLSTGVPLYLVSAMSLGVYFAMSTGTLDAVVYDTVLEETGSSDAYERTLGRIRLIESVSLVGSSLAGGWLAGLLSLRATYFLTVPFMVLAAVALLWFREPRLHEAGRPESLRRHLAQTYRILGDRGRVLPIVAAIVLAAVTTSFLFEFGPLWLVALAVPAVAFGPYWAALTAAFGIAGALAGRVRLDSPRVAVGGTALLAATGLVLTTGASAALIVPAQVVMAVLTILAGIHLSKLLHDAVPSAVRSGVASGVSALSWMVFLPVALVAGAVIDGGGVRSAGWMVLATAILTGVLLVGLARRSAAAPAPAPCPEAELVGAR
ncbi:MFS transporter [Jiangella alkaliphila]|uniref:Predicted arabinose efflux permease, MFS family n=1 Tax=Jiangella alkaliphila TaxID=419479 RepID=A0A1H2G0F2_9ACTN|nr:MFS transporter [Jiangella alkaliphila]SDU13056.1 Predicted arabinose efflux permease, MFS family [Jiangella alkaliphila]